MARRLVLALALAAILAGGTALLLGSRPDPATGQAGDYPVSIVGPDGAVWWDGTVAGGAGATPLSTLEAAAAAGGFTVDVEPHGLGAYVRGIGPFHETATGGWNFCIDAGDGYAWVGAAADGWPLESGDRVLWLWVEDGSEVCTG